jgi:1,4-dihydroxy-2-naphthoyl-CoA hydrolase
MATGPAQLSPVGFEHLYGLELIELGESRAVAKVLVRDELTRPPGIVHGGVYTAIADSLASHATARAVAADGKNAIGLSSQTSLLRPISAGAIHAVAVARHRGRTTWVWEVEMSDDQSRLCALTRITIAVTDAAGE